MTTQTLDGAKINASGTIVRYEKITPFARGDKVETRLMVGRNTDPEAPFTTGTTVFPAGSAAPLHTQLRRASDDPIGSGRSHGRRRRHDPWRNGHQFCSGERAALFS